MNQYERAHTLVWAAKIATFDLVPWGQALQTMRARRIKEGARGGTRVGRA